MAEISRAFQMSDGKADRNVNNNGTNLSTLQDRMVQSMQQQQQYNGSVPTFPTPVNQQQGNVQRARGRLNLYNGSVQNLSINLFSKWHFSFPSGRNHWTILTETLQK
jgi:hypothetical protein